MPVRISWITWARCCVFGWAFAGLANLASAQEVVPSPSDLPLQRRDVVIGQDYQQGGMITGEASQFLPQLVDGRFVFPAITAPSIATDDIGNQGRVPQGFRGDQPEPTVVLPEDATDRGLDWGFAISNWTAPNTFSHPRYFEDRMLERHGHQRFPCFQPLVSGARFGADAAMLPYLMAVRPPCDCESTVGYFRSGTCVPAFLQRPPLDRAGLIAETAALTGTIFVLP